MRHPSLRPEGSEITAAHDASLPFSAPACPPKRARQQNPLPCAFAAASAHAPERPRRWCGLPAPPSLHARQRTVVAITTERNRCRCRRTSAQRRPRWQFRAVWGPSFIVGSHFADFPHCGCRRRCAQPLQVPAIGSPSRKAQETRVSSGVSNIPLVKSVFHDADCQRQHVNVMALAMMMDGALDQDAVHQPERNADAKTLQPCPTTGHARLVVRSSHLRARTTRW